MLSSRPDCLARSGRYLEDRLHAHEHQLVDAAPDDFSRLLVQRRNLLAALHVVYAEGAVDVEVVFPFAFFFVGVFAFLFLAAAREGSVAGHTMPRVVHREERRRSRGGDEERVGAAGSIRAPDGEFGIGGGGTNAKESCGGESGSCGAADLCLIRREERRRCLLDIRDVVGCCWL